MKTKTTLAGLAIALLALTGCSSPVEAETPQEPVTETPAEATPEAEEADAEEDAEEAEDSEAGKRSNPHPIGTALSNDDWELTINSVNLDANAAVTDANMFNEDPEEGNTYILVNLTVTYTGDDEDGTMPFYSLEYVTADGNTINSYDAMAVAPEPIDSTSTLYPGASASGNEVFSVPADTAGEGTLAVSIDMLADKTFVAVQ